MYMAQNKNTDLKQVQSFQGKDQHFIYFKGEPVSNPFNTYMTVNAMVKLQARSMLFIIPSPKTATGKDTRKLVI